MPAPNPYTIFNDDNNGAESRTGSWIDSATTNPTLLEPLLLALIDVTSGRVFKHAIGNRQVLAFPAAIANAYDVADKVRMQYTDEFGNAQFETFPAPKVGIFLPDGETVDKDDLDVIELNVQVLANLKGRGGEALSTWVGGRRIRRQRRA